MTRRVGLIEWMDNTAVLKETIYSQLTEAEKVSVVNQSRPQLDHVEKLGSNRPGDYHMHYQKYSRTETSLGYRRRCNMVPWDLLRCAYIKMSASPEAFFTLKCNLATSHAQLCISQWVLGIGDRHLSNFMIDIGTGKMVGIDFGHAFGSASQQNAYKQIRSTTTGAEAEDLSKDLVWYPMQKIDWARKKLDGHNPVYITRDEIKLNGASRSSIFKHYESVLIGDKSIDIRARLPKQGLSVEQPVASLLNQATDPNILGRMWVGWEPWV